MFFCNSHHPPIPTQDLISWVFDGPIYIDPSNPLRSISYNQARVLVRKLAAGFRKAGLKRGDGVLIHSFNDVYYSILFLGIIAAGGVFTGTNPSYSQFELSHHIKTSKSKFLISEPGNLKPLIAAADATGIPRSKIWIFDSFEHNVPQGMKSWRTLLDNEEEDWIRFDDLETSRRTPAALLFSSGTTGLPKAAILSHYNLVAQHTLVYEANPRPYQMIRLIPVPIFHAAVAPVTHTSALRAGVPTYIMRRFHLQKYLEYMQQYKVTDMLIVPPIAVALINSPLLDGPYLKSVKYGLVGAAPMNKITQARFREKLPPGVPFTQGFGMTEANSLALLTPYPEDDDTGSVGRLIPGLEAKLIDETGNDISGYEVCGELCLRGPSITPGYFENDQANAESFDRDGWFKTGDIAYCARDSKKWYVVDRKKDLIKVRGFQVAPPELEAVLLEHPEVIDAAVIGVKFPGDDSERPRAYVVTKNKDTRPTEDELKKFASSKLARYKNLTGGVRFVDIIPKNASGKILKKILREQAKMELEKLEWRPRARL
ncbi:MAG: hypothetical protein M1834_001197 [Cirrosporium novae-zelandiae]|nr:MAG: hypothetical protein M1834_001197 [Cirrosporium novae-zelandiae]